MDESVLEAARLDGARGLNLLVRIILPLMRRQTVFVTTVMGIGAFQSVDHVFVLTLGGPSGTSNLLLYHLWQVRFDRLDLGKGDAITVILIAVLLLMTVTNFLAGERGER